MSQSYHVSPTFKLLHEWWQVIDSANLLRIFYRQGIILGSGRGKDERLTK